MQQKQKVSGNMDRIYKQILNNWDICGDPLKDIAIVMVMDFKARNDTNDDIDTLLKKFSEDIISRIINGIGTYLGVFGVHNLKIMLEEFINEKIKEELHRRIKQMGDKKAYNSTRKSTIHGKTEGRFFYIN